MPAATPQYVRDLSIQGEFNALTDGQIQNVIDRVLPLYKQLVPEDLYLPVTGLHTAHLIKSQLLEGGVGGGGGGGGQLIMAKVGPLEKRYAQNVVPIKPASGLDDSTSYGRECERLLRSRFPSIRTSNP